MRAMPIHSRQKRYENVDEIPWRLIESHQSQAWNNHDQSLQTLASRGGLSYSEAVAILNDRKWQPMSDLAAAQIIRRMIDSLHYMESLTCSASPTSPTSS